MPQRRIICTTSVFRLVAWSQLIVFILPIFRKAHHKTQVRPLVEKITVREDRVRLREVSVHQRHDVVQLSLVFVPHKGYLVPQSHSVWRCWCRWYFHPSSYAGALGWEVISLFIAMPQGMGGWYRGCGRARSLLFLVSVFTSIIRRACSWHVELCLSPINSEAFPSAPLLHTTT